MKISRIRYIVKCRIKYFLKSLPKIPYNLYLIARFPFLYCKGTILYTWNDSIDKGWRKCFAHQMWVEVKRELKHTPGSSMHIYDIKEKYGALQIDCGATEGVHDILNKYEYISLRTCHICGRPAKYVSEGWIEAYCEDCAKNNNITNKSEYYKDMDWYGYRRF